MHLSMLSPRVGGGGGVYYSWESDSASFSLGGNFDIWVLPWGREFDMAKSCFSKKMVPRAVFPLTFSSAGKEQFLTGIF